MCLYSREKSINLIIFTFICYLCCNPVSTVGSGAVSLSTSTIDHTLANNELVFINFYADWCPFSSMLAPVFEEAAEKVHALFSTPRQIVMAKIDCYNENTLASRFHITKYPTLKLIRNGQPARREYRGKRSVEAFVEYIKKQLEDQIVEFTELAELKKLNTKKRIIIGFFETKDCKEYNIFRKAASNLKEDCQFHVGIGDSVKAMQPPGLPIIVFRPDIELSNEKDEMFNGSLLSFDEINIWMGERCVPLVREITFENAEELTEEGLPFLILFYRVGKDEEIVKRFKDIASTELINEKSTIAFLTADGQKFVHPLHQLGKSQSDLPLIAIDSFRHMYLFPDIKDIEIPGRLKSFIQNLYSGNLHRKFHYGPDPDTNNEIKGCTTPPESTFKKLAPSRNRYTLLRDEL